MLTSILGLASMISWQMHIFTSTRWVMAWSVTWSCWKCHSSWILSASPAGSPALPLGYAVTCFMLKDTDSKGPRLPYDTLLQDHRLKLSFCVHPAYAGTIESATKRARMVDTFVKHSMRAGVVVVGEIGIDNHRNQTQKARDNCKLFLDALSTALQQDTVLKTMPSVLHVREAEDGSNPEAAASQPYEWLEYRVSIAFTSIVSWALSLWPTCGHKTTPRRCLG